MFLKENNGIQDVYFNMSVKTWEHAIIIQLDLFTFIVIFAISI